MTPFRVRSFLASNLSRIVDAANARTPDATWKYGWKDYILPVRGRLFSHRINDKFIANADVPAILNLQPRLLVPHLSFNAIGSLPAILTFRAILRRRCESSCCRLPLSLSRIAKQFVHGDLAPHHSARACSSAMIHTGELPMEAALCALLVRLTTRFYNADSPTICLEAPTRVLLASQMPSRSSTFCFAHLHDDAAASLSVPMKSDLPLRCRRCTSASAWGASVRSRCRSARMMEADDGESREHARPRIAAYPTLTLRRGLCSCVPDRIPNRIRGFPALRRRLTPRACGTFSAAGEAAVRVHENLSRILVKRCACFALSVENRELSPFYWELRSTSAQAREAQSDGIDAARRAHCRTIHHSRSPASAWIVSIFIGSSIAIFLDLCDTARSHARTPEHAGHHAREVASKSALLPFLSALAEPRAAASDAVDHRTRVALVLSLSYQRCHEPTHSCSRYHLALLHQHLRSGNLKSYLKPPSFAAACASASPSSPIVALLLSHRCLGAGTLNAKACRSRSSTRRHTTAGARSRLPHLVDAAAGSTPRVRLHYALLTAAAGRTTCPLALDGNSHSSLNIEASLAQRRGRRPTTSLRCTCPGVGRLRTLRVDDVLVPVQPPRLFVCAARKDLRPSLNWLHECLGVEASIRSPTRSCYPSGAHECERERPKFCCPPSSTPRRPRRRSSTFIATVMSFTPICRCTSAASGTTFSLTRIIFYILSLGIYFVVHTISYMCN
ncbi:hypothetical protein C8R45DRAFT_1101719 [Mycena sanguinolenta]|nr:hypothetical protein C8R45DRAFT_1101719 [Mycena sanguinolenta]